MKNTTLFAIIVIAVALIGGFIMFQGNSGATVQAVSAGTLPGETQQVTVGMKDFNYYPNTVSVKAGVPIALTLDKSVQGCLRSFTIRELGISKVARSPTEAITFTIPEAGEYTGSCSMGMGSIKKVAK